MRNYIGNELKNRMNLMSISTQELSKITFIDKNIIDDIINNRLAYEYIDEFDLALLCNALHCDISYFIDIKVRNKDLLIATHNKKDSLKSISIKAKIQDFINDYAFMQTI